VIYPLWTAALGAAVAAYLPLAVLRRLRRGTPLRVRARLGLDAGPRSPGPSAWIHAVSVGEVMAALPLVDGLRRLAPERPLVVTTVTDTGAEVVRERLGASVSHRFFPLDFPPAVRRTVAAIRPAFLVLMETELWPNTLRIVAGQGVPIMVANGRLSDRSFRRYRRLRRLLRPVLDHVTVFAMQSEEDARRILALGAPPERVVVTGNVKHEPAPDGGGAVEVWQRLLGLRPGQPVWIAGSTHRGEEAAVLDAHAEVRRQWPDLVLILAPRHPERVDEVLALIAARGWPAVRRSALPRERREGAVIVLDTVGELAQLYAVADVVFVGGSLVAIGGHNLLEPALRRKPVLFGPYTMNFREPARLLAETGGGLVVTDARTLAAELGRLLADAPLRAKVGALAFEAAASRHGAVQATLELVERFLLRGRADA
jgi:3-deoxy-D-manno-octulosonic-acid transferase